MGRKIRMIEEKDIPSGTGTDNVDFALYKDGFVESFTFNGKSINILLSSLRKIQRKKPNTNFGMAEKLRRNKRPKNQPLNGIPK